MNYQKFSNVVVTLAIVILLVVVSVILVKGQETEEKPATDVNAGINVRKIPELNLLKIQNLNLRFQLLANQRALIETELKNIQVQVLAEVENLRDSLGTDTGSWNVDFQKGVFTRKPVTQEEKKE